MATFNIPWKPHTGQLAILNCMFRFIAVACGRRWGKTTFITIKVLMQALTNINNNWEKDIGLIFLSDANSTPVWNKLKQSLKPFIESKDESTRTLRIKAGTVDGEEKFFNIEFWSAEAIVKNETVRGRSYVLLVIDEAGSIKGLLAMWQALLFPTLNDHQGSAIFCGTPKGFNDFHEIFQFEKNPLLAGMWKSFTAWSIDNPHFKKEEWDLAQAMYTEKYFDQEYKAKFVRDTAIMFTRNMFPVIDSLPNKKVKKRVMYWDIANSKDTNLKGDFLSSIRLTVFENDNNVYLDNFFRLKGRWGTTYPLMKLEIKKHLDCTHYIEAEGVGSMAWEVINQDRKDVDELFGYDIQETNRSIFNATSKVDRASRWALKAMLKEMVLVDHPDLEEFFTQVTNFPANNIHDDYVDNVSGAVIALIIAKAFPISKKTPQGEVEMPRVDLSEFVTEDDGMTEDEIMALMLEMGVMQC